MTREEIRSMIGGYATGSLSAAERKALFDAALDDQELFDELMRDQALKELLDEPGVKTRLLTALEPKRERWWTSASVWVAAGAVATAFLIGFVMLRPSEQVEVARVMPPAKQFVAPAPVVRSAPVEVPLAAPPPELPQSPSVTNAIPLPAVVEHFNPPPPPPPARAVAQASLLKSQLVPGPAAPPAPSPANSFAGGAPAVGTGAIGGARGGGGGGGRGGGGRGGRGGAAGVVPRAAVPARFAFDYSLTPEGVLRITPTADGFLTVGVTSATASTTLVSGRAVPAGSLTEVPMPADAVTAQVIFAAQSPSPQAAQTATQGALAVNSLSAADAISSMDPPSGTKSDPNPSPTSRLIATFSVKH